MAFEDLELAGLKRGMLPDGAEVRLVDPGGTSQTCPGCGTIRPKTLKARLHRCDCMQDRDVAAAQIVHRRVFGSGRDIGLRT